MSRYIHHTPLFATFLFILWWFRFYFTSEIVPSVDLPSHIALVEHLRDHLLRGRITFYDYTTFSGWVAFHFYGFFPAFINAIFSFLFDLFSENSVRLATHLLLVFGVALLPYSFFLASRPLVSELFGNVNSRWISFTHSFLVCTFTLWFINHDQQWFGIGAAAPMNIGLFSQLFGWHGLLVYLYFLFRVIQGDSRAWKGVAISYALILITHTLTFVFCSYLGVFFFLWSRGARRLVAYSHALGVGLVSFWFIPMVWLLGDYTAFDPSRPQGDILELLFRYPIYGLIRTFKDSVVLLDPISILAPLLLVLIFVNRSIHRSGLTFGLLIALISGSLVFSSGYVASSLPFGLHYYRFNGYLFLLFTLLFLVAPLALLKRERFFRVSVGTLLVIAMFALVTTVSLPHSERKMLFEKVGTDYLKDEDMIFDHFKSLEGKKRVYFEYLTNYKVYPSLSAHYLDSGLFAATGNESMVNSHLQESLTYRYITAAANSLGAKTYHVPHIYSDEYNLTDEQKLEQLKDFGITHVVTGKKKFRLKMDHLVALPPKKIGRYRIFELQTDSHLVARPVTKPIIGFIDLKGNLPFTLLQKYFYSHWDLYSRFELVELNAEGLIPESIQALLLNTDKTEKIEQYRNDLKTTQIIGLNFKNPYRLDHYNPHYPHNVQLDHFREVREYLGKTIRLGKRLKGMDFIVSDLVLDDSRMVWSEDGQSFELAGLKPGVFYRINYSYFPYWASASGTIFRGLGERMLITSEADKIEVTFSRFNHKANWIGWSVTLISLILFWAVPFRKLRPS